MVFLSRGCQKVENVHKTFINTKFPFKNVLFFDHRVRNVPQVSSETSLPWLVKNKPSAPIRRVENKVEFLERQFHSEKLSFVHKKETEHSFELSLSIGVFYRRIFNLEMQKFSLKNNHMMNQIRFFPPSLNGRHNHLTFVGEWGIGDCQRAASREAAA